MDPVTKNKADPTLKAIFRYKEHPRIFAIHSNYEKESFRFLEIYIEDIKKNIPKLVKNKASQYSDIPIKIIKRTWTFFPNFYIQTLTALSNHLCSYLV